MEKFDEVRKLIREIEDAAADGDYLFRGEAKYFDEVSSGFYREYFEDIGLPSFDDGRVNFYFDRYVLEQAGKHPDQKEKSYRQIASELQHYGGKTNLIDFTSSLLVAVFFACNNDEFSREDGRVVLLDKKKYRDDHGEIWDPKSPSLRIKAHKSIFVQPKNGVVHIPKDKIVRVKQHLKKTILDYLEKKENMSTEYMFNDLHGFIKHQKLNRNTFKRDMFNGFIQNITKEIESNPCTDHLLLRSWAHEQLGNINQAINDADHIIKICDKVPNDYAPMFYSWRAKLYYNKGDLKKSVSDLKKTIDLVKNQNNALQAESHAYLAKIEWEKNPLNDDGYKHVEFDLMSKHIAEAGIYNGKDRDRIEKILLDTFPSWFLLAGATSISVLFSDQNFISNFLPKGDPP